MEKVHPSQTDPSRASQKLPRRHIPKKRGNGSRSSRQELVKAYKIRIDKAIAELQLLKNSFMEDFGDDDDRMMDESSADEDVEDADEYDDYPS